MFHIWFKFDRNDPDDILNRLNFKVIQGQMSTLGQPVLIGLKFDRNDSEDIIDFLRFFVCLNERNISFVAIYAII